MTETQVSEINGILDHLVRKEKSAIALIGDLQEKFCSQVRAERAKLPYSINLLDEIHADENAHSRIFLKLVGFHKDSEYSILRSFLKTLGPPFSELEVKTPILTAEKDRIDLRIRDLDFSIIIENKINGAGDQETQLERYIKKERNGGVAESGIYILYLTNDGGSPIESSISERRRREFGLRYKEINYYDHIYPFLKKEVLEHVELLAGDSSVTHLRSALNQYIDYLEGRFNCRHEETEMRESIARLLEEEFKISDPEISFKKKIQIICEKQEYLSEMVNYIPELERRALAVRLNQCKDEILSHEHKGIGKKVGYGRFGLAETGIRFFPEAWDTRYAVTIEFAAEYSELFVGIEDLSSSSYQQPPTNPLYAKIEHELGDSVGPSDHWLYAKYIAAKHQEVLDLFSDQDYMKTIFMEIDLITGNDVVTSLLNQ